MQNDIYKLTIVAHHNAVPMVNVLWFREEVAGLPPDQRATLANDFAGQALDHPVNVDYRNVTSNMVVFDQVQVQRMVPYEAGAFNLALGGYAGSTGGTPAPPCVSPCVTLTTAQPGRRGRGRLYAFPGAASDVQWGTLFATYATALNNMMSTWSNRYVQASGYGASGFRLGVWSRVIAGADPPFNAAGFFPLTGWQVRTNLRALSRRTVPVG